MYLSVGIQGPTLTARECAALASETIDEVILFGRNIRTRPQVIALIRELHRYKCKVGIDHEGGRVHRFPKGFAGVQHFPAMNTVAAGAMGPRKIRTVARTMAVELASLGFDAWYAPVADVLHTDGDRIIGDRSFGHDLAKVCDCVQQFIEGSVGYGLARCVKHFPGHGRYTVDSHVALPVSRLSIERWLQTDAKPFIAAIDAGVERIMAAHVLWPTLDPSRGSWQSKRFVEVLRKYLGDNVQLFTDDISMKAIACKQRNASRPKIIHEAHNAGYDAVLSCAADALLHFS